MIEQDTILKISDNDVMREYFLETGGEDTGLIVLDSLKLWRKQGWVAAGSRYFITAFAEIDRTAPSEVKRTVYTDLGVGLGLAMPRSAQREFEAAKPWTTTSGPGSVRGSWGGHYVYVTGYTALGPTCVTWGQKQRMSWDFFREYCDEAYAIIDAIDTSKKRRTLDRAKLDKFLKTL